jgi:diguanylate cyclase
MPFSYSPWLVSLSIAVAILVSYTSLQLASRVAESQHSAGRIWLFLGALSMGVGIWCMHFIGMLAISLPIQLRYDIGLTLASLGVAVVTSGFAIKIASSPKPKLSRQLLCSAVMGAGIATMHYSGMRAIRVTPAIVYDVALVAASVGIAVSASFVALWLTFSLRSAAHKYLRLARVGASVIMGLAIAGMHYTGMAASHFAPGAFCRGGVAFDDHWLAISVAVATIALLAITLISMVFDAHLQSAARLHALRLEQANRGLIHQATHDPLTDLPNRSLFIERLQQAVDEADDATPLVGVMFADLDRFNTVNDLRGHSDGDAILKQVASRLRDLALDVGTAARLGGDEFLILVRAADIQSIIDSANEIVRRLSQTYVVGTVEMHLTASLGITTFPFDNSLPSGLISHADEAMYEAKHRGGNGIQFFVPGTTIFTPDRMQLENDLRHAVELGQLRLHYQPQVNIARGRIICLEALARWQHPVRGWIPPNEFIPLAEASDLIVSIGQWILEEACRQAQIWRGEGFADIRIAVNLSARQFRQPDVVSMIQQAIARHGLQPHNIEIELTESIVMSDADRSIETLHKLTSLGLHIAVDDFGTGYSSIGYLKRLPVSILKIDRSFIIDLGTSTKSNAIVKAVISLAHSLGMSVVAEGVETEAQLSHLRDFGCDQYQGYLFSRPQPAVDIGALLRRGALPVEEGTDERRLLGSAG